MKCTERRNEAACNPTPENAGTNIQQPPQFSLQSGPAAPMQRQVAPNPSGPEEDSEGSGGGLGLEEGGRILQRQTQVPAVADHPAPEQDPWERFAIEFSEHFNSILNSFDPDIQTSTLNPELNFRRAQLGLPRTTTPATPGARNRGRRRQNAAATTPSTAAQTPANETVAQAPAESQAAHAPVARASLLRQRFSETHRVLLTEFFRTNIIPDRLFSGGDTGTLTEPQRILLSSVILTSGRHRRGAVEQRVHGHNCGHWVGLVNQYAGLGPRIGQRGGFMPGFDHNGNIMTNSGALHEEFAGTMHRVGDHTVQEDEDLGSLPANTGQASDFATDNRTEQAVTLNTPADANGSPAGQTEQQSQAARRQRARAASYGRHESLPMAQFDTIQPGDWLWCYNANASITGDHSVVFVRWVTGERSSERNSRLRYRTALCFSQPSPDRGGEQHMANLGNMYSAENPRVSTITRVRRTTDSDRTIRPGDVLPAFDRRELRAMNSANQTFIHQVQRRASAFTPEGFLEHMRQVNAGRITSIGFRMSALQQSAFTDANATQDFDSMVQLYQRLRQLNENSETLASTIQSNAEGGNGRIGLDRRHARNRSDRAGLLARLNAIPEHPDAALPAAERRRMLRERHDLTEQIHTLDVSEPYSLSHPGNLPGRSFVVVDGKLASTFRHSPEAPYLVEKADANGRQPEPPRPQRPAGQVVRH